uniref:Uncharacterized protein n=1 Tax=Paramormyrops kingsleyae TaxID=1676925 RepID=A0A3B3RFA2_9TELE
PGWRLTDVFSRPSADWQKLTSMCSSVKITGSVTNTRLDSLLTEAEIMCEFTAMGWLRPPASGPSLMVAFSVLRNRPRLLD